MLSGAAQSYWNGVCTHEAGHAVASLVLRGEAADIFVKSTEDDPDHLYAASYRAVNDARELMADSPIDPINKIIQYASGAKAEEICLGVTQSSGRVKDWRMIQHIRGLWEGYSDEQYWRALLGQAEQVEKAIAKIADYRRKLHEIETEIDSGFPRTTNIIKDHREILGLIAAETLRNLTTVGEAGLSHGHILLSERRLRGIWDAR
jgi:hypothetical protein